MQIEYFMLVFFAIFVGTFAWRYFKFGNLTGAVLGGLTQREVGNVELIRSMGVTKLLHVYAMESPEGERFIGVSLVTKVPLGFSEVPFRLNRAQAQQLAYLLKAAARE